jgi:protein-S-isoprenylcysteine O-methyltransferase Ste14
MNSQVNKLRDLLKSFSFNFSSILIIFAQYVPCASVWFGIMSIPLISYLFFFFQYPSILHHDLIFFLGFHGNYIAYFGLILFLYCFTYQILHRKQLITSGPYRLVRHPQYVAFIILTFGLTSVSLQTSPIIPLFIPLDINRYLIIFYIWLAEVMAYIFLAKVEDFSLKAKYGYEYNEYANKVGFMIPKLNLKR